MSKLKNLKDLYEHELKLLHDTEKQILNTIPEMVEKATNEDLKNTFRENMEESRLQKERLEQIANTRNFEIGGCDCVAAEGLINEEKEMISADAEPAVKDAGLIAAAQRMEHYKIASYGAACQYARLLDDKDALDKLKECIKETKNTDARLTQIAKDAVNKEAEMLV